MKECDVKLHYMYLRVIMMVGERVTVDSCYKSGKNCYSNCHSFLQKHDKYSPVTD